jgi:hypothetical protein
MTRNRHTGSTTARAIEASVSPLDFVSGVGMARLTARADEVIE